MSDEFIDTFSGCFSFVVVVVFCVLYTSEREKKKLHIVIASESENHYSPLFFEIEKNEIQRIRRRIRHLSLFALNRVRNSPASLLCSI